MTFLTTARAILGEDYVLSAAQAARYGIDFMGKYKGAPATVLRPANTEEVSQLMRAAHETGQPIVPVSGSTGLNGGVHAPGGVLLSLDRLNQIEEIRVDARVAVVGAGVILSNLHDATGAHDLSFPLTFGAKGSAMIGGVLSTNAGGSNVLRYGNTRDLCLGLEVVLADGRVMDLMNALHKDNTGYDLRDLMIGAEGTLGIITRAVLKLVPLPRAYATAMIAVPTLGVALEALNSLQAATGGAVEAFEYMPRAHFDRLIALKPETRAPFERAYDINILLEVGATSARDATANADGSLPIMGYLETVLGDLLDSGAVLDAVIAQTEAQRAQMWAAREAAAEIAFSRSPFVLNDIALPLDGIEPFFASMEALLPLLDAGAEGMAVAHLGDGNIHYMVYPSHGDPAHLDAIMDAVEGEVRALGGSFSAEHGVGLSKKPSMARRKDPVALEVMRAIKSALDPKGILNPGKVLPD
ncbi:MAG: FAD-binding oxidoreductase [Maritimibacter sp.]